MRLQKLISVLIIAASFLAAIPAIALASSAYLGEPGKPGKPQESPDIVLEKHVIQVWLRRGFAEVEEVYQLYNTGEAQEFVMGLPEEVNTKTSVQYGVYNFKPFIDGKEADPRTIKTTGKRIGALGGSINWYAHNVFIAKKQRRIIVHKYWARIVPLKNKFVMPLEPAATWKDNIGQAQYKVNLVGSLTERDIVYPSDYGDYAGRYAVLPTGFKAGKNQIIWAYNDFNPKQSIEIGIVSGGNKPGLEADASGFYTGSNKQFLPAYAFDEDPATAWGVSGPGVEEWLAMSLGKERWVRELRIISGYGAMESMYKFYNRPKEIVLRFSGGLTQRVTLRDELEIQYIPIKPVQTKFVELEISSIYKGIYPDTTYISEIEFGEHVTDTRYHPAEWNVGLDQIKAFGAQPKHPIANIAKVVAVSIAALVLIFATWKVIDTIRWRLGRF